MKKYKEVKTNEDSNKRVKRSIVLMSILILIGITIFIGTSYALFSIMVEGKKKVSLETEEFKVDMEDGEYIKVDALGTMSDEEGKMSKPYTFTVKKNAGTIGAYYSLYLTDESGELNTYYLKYELKGTDGSVKEGRIGTLSRFNINQYLEAGSSVTYELRLWLDINTPNSEQGKSYQSKIALEGSQEKIITGVERLLKDYTNSEDAEFNEDTKNKMFIYHHEETEQQKGWSKEELTDYRYIGANPNNYVNFNGEEAGWRIIGVFTVENEQGEKEQRIKLIKNTFINWIVWDNNTNDWSQASLMKNLNFSTGTASLNLITQAKKMTSDAKWYLGGTTNMYTFTGNTSYFYNIERGTETCKTIGACDTERPMNWIGKVGLMYPSDYGYATSGGENVTKEQCLSTELYSWDASDECYKNNWIFDGNSQWTLSPNSDNLRTVFRVCDDGRIRGYHSIIDAIEARPVVYLISTIQIIQGTGSQENPFILSI